MRNSVSPRVRAVVQWCAKNYCTSSCKIDESLVHYIWSVYLSEPLDEPHEVCDKIGHGASLRRSQRMKIKSFDRTSRKVRCGCLGSSLQNSLMKSCLARRALDFSPQSASFNSQWYIYKFSAEENGSRAVTSWSPTDFGMLETKR